MGSHYEYICTHVDDFMIASRDPNKVMDQLLKIYEIKNIGSPTMYLGADIESKDGFWTISSKTYVKEKLQKVKSIFGDIKIYNTPMMVDDQPEMDE